MAQKKSNRKTSQRYPVVRTLRIDNGTASGAKKEVNVEQFLSKANHRLYRQARYYEVKIDADSDLSQNIAIYALADTWAVERSLKMAYDSYLENSESERKAIKKSNLARWQDFRVQSGQAIGHCYPMMYDGFTQIPLPGGEFENTTVVDSAGVTRFFSWRSASTGSIYSIMAEYDKAGNSQPNPDTTTGDMPYDDLMADDSAVMADFLQTKGNKPPYELNDVGAGYAWVKVGELRAGSATNPAQKLSTGYFTAPCGIILIEDTSGGPAVLSPLSITAKSGDYKGVHAPSMLE